ncbi:MAG TPA: PA14 domain-containing protein, partial [Caldilineaceae bacterium]|nr:PA14 domain-containing protein [Caldilineaceae bacterium]
LQLGNPLDYNWGSSSPLPDQLGDDFWSARWTGTFHFDDGNFVFQAHADDGVRVWLDGYLVIDQWVDGYKEVTNRFLGVGQGEHTVQVEYYERSGLASLRLWWFKEAGAFGPR